ncbi:hypothetical protein WAI453_001988 [Rhynchosporium graminicola]
MSHSQLNTLYSGIIHEGNFDFSLATTAWSLERPHPASATKSSSEAVDMQHTEVLPHSVEISHFQIN